MQKTGVASAALQLLHQPWWWWWWRVQQVVFWRGEGEVVVGMRRGGGDLTIMKAPAA